MNPVDKVLCLVEDYLPARVTVDETMDLLVTTKSGMVVRIPVSEIRVQGRATKGVRIMRIDDDDEVMSIARIINEEEDEDAGADGEASDKDAPEESEA